MLREEKNYIWNRLTNLLPPETWYVQIYESYEPANSLNFPITKALFCICVSEQAMAAAGAEDYWRPGYIKIEEAPDLMDMVSTALATST